MKKALSPPRAEHPFMSQKNAQPRSLSACTVCRMARFCSSVGPRLHPLGQGNKLDPSLDRARHALLLSAMVDLT